MRKQYVEAEARNDPDDKPVKLTIELPAAIHRDLVAYGNALGRETDQGVVEPAKLIGPMLARFMATDRAFEIAEVRVDLESSAPGEIQIRTDGVSVPRRA